MLTLPKANDNVVSDKTLRGKVKRSIMKNGKQEEDEMEHALPQKHRDPKSQGLSTKFI